MYLSLPEEKNPCVGRLLYPETVIHHKQVQNMSNSRSRATTDKKVEQCLRDELKDHKS